MIENADPDQVDRAGDHWRAAADQLGGLDGSGGIRKAFKDAIDHALAHWEGPASKNFLEAANDVLRKIDRSYRHARNAEMAMIGTRETGRDVGIAANLRKAQETMKSIHQPDTTDRVKDKASDGSRDDAQFHRDMANPNIDARTALELNRENLSLSKERQVEAVIVMEELAWNYKQQSNGMRPGVDRGGDWPSEPNDQTPPSPVVMPTIGGDMSPKSSAPSSGAKGSGIGTLNPATGPRAKGISGGIGSTAPKQGSQVGTGLNGVSGGLGAGGGRGGVGLGGSTGAGAGGVGGGSGTSGMPGLPGAVAGGAARGVAGAGARGGRAGMPGTGGAPGAGARTGGAKGAGRGGGLARQRGGVVGAAKGAGAGAQGGSGLHRSRGGTQAGKKAGPAGMAGAPGARGGKANEEKERGQRPDYLVEDEETWTPERNVTPKVIE
ncbi:hypothetical protein [Streptomyces sp. 8N706]|uniref:hypothetical protein n=1 Tax=Streptomyces sp. 8N706 TaxID=3457416 RepID=UPI003FD129A9